MAYVGIGFLPLIVALPIGLFAFHDVDDPKVAKRAEGLAALRRETGSTMQQYGFTFIQAPKDWRLWLLSAIFLPLSSAIGGPITNLETMMGSKGFERADAVLLASFLVYSVYAGRLMAGYLLDFIWAPAIACGLMIMPATSMMMFAGADPSYSQMVSAVVLSGVAAGVEYDLLAYLVSRHFGVRSYARIYGALYALFGLGAGFGLAAFGAVYSNTGSYDQARYYSMWGFIICSLALLLLGCYRDEQLKAMV